MKSSMMETEGEKCSEYASVKFLLKQVYAAHTSKVKELESEIQNLKRQLEESARLASSAQLECQKWKSECQRRKADLACEESLSQRVLIDNAENGCGNETGSICEKELEVIDETIVEVAGEKYTCEVENSPDAPRESKIQSQSFEVDLISNTCKAPSPSSGHVADMIRTDLDSTVDAQDDAVLVPDTLEVTVDIPKSFPSGKNPVLGSRKSRSTGDYRKPGKENKDLSSELKGMVPNASNKKRALSELTLNEVLSCNKRLNTKQVSKVEGEHIKVNSGYKDNTKNPPKSGQSGKWAELFHDFRDSSSKSSHPASNKADKISSSSGEDDDFIVKGSEESSTWKSSVKKSVNKSAKPLKSTSRFKMTLEAPDPNAKKVNYKQTKLLENCFVTLKTDATSDDACKIVENSEETIDMCVNGSSEADVSQLARLAASIGNGNDKSHVLPDSSLGEETQHHVSTLSETLCPLELIAKHKPPEESDEEEIFIIDCVGGDSVKSNGYEVEEIKQNCDSFDRVPAEQEPSYKYKEDVVRNKNKRKQLDGFDCKECEKYYAELGISDEEKRQRMKSCSRHRSKFMPPATPDHFWEIEFPDTEECRARGYINETQKVQLKSRRRKPLVKD